MVSENSDLGAVSQSLSATSSSHTINAPVSSVAVTSSSGMSQSSVAGLNPSASNFVPVPLKPAFVQSTWVYSNAPTYYKLSHGNLFHESWNSSFYI